MNDSSYYAPVPVRIAMFVHPDQANSTPSIRNSLLRAVESQIPSLHTGLDGTEGLRGFYVETTLDQGREPFDHIVNILADLREFCAQSGIDFAEALAVSRETFDEIHAQQPSPSIATHA